MFIVYLPKSIIHLLEFTGKYAETFFIFPRIQVASKLFHINFPFHSKCNFHFMLHISSHESRMYITHTHPKQIFGIVLKNNKLISFANETLTVLYMIFVRFNFHFPFQTLKLFSLVTFDGTVFSKTTGIPSFISIWLVYFKVNN